MRARENRQGALALAVLLPCLIGWSGTQAAGSERYEYDGLGRLVRVIDGSNQATEYHYDAAGNITAVVSAGTAVPPTVSSVSPATLRRSTTTRITLAGGQLANASIQASDAGILLSRVTRSATAVSFDLQVLETAALGAATLTVSTAAGSATASLKIRPSLPAALVSPLPIAVAPGGLAAYDLVLDHADDEAHSFSLSMLRTAVATVSPASVSLAAGQTSVRFQVRGVAAGNTELRGSSATLAVVKAPVFVTANPEGVNAARAVSVGVELARAATPPSGFPATVAAPLVGVVTAGTAWLDTQPRHLPQGSTRAIRISGLGLPADLAVSIEPAAGLTIGSPQVAADGSAADLAVAVAPDAAAGPRRLSVAGGGVALIPAAPRAAQLDVVAPAPELTSVSPLLLSPGSTLHHFQVRGRNLQDATGVEFLGGGVAVGSTRQVEAGGRLMTLSLQISPAAEPGPRVVVVHAPGGSSPAAASAGNTVRIIEDADGLGSLLQQAPLVGVELGGAAPPRSIEASRPAPQVGVAVGPILVDISPRSIAVGESRTLVLGGASLQGLDGIVFTPADGLTAGSPSVATDGRSATVPVTAAGDAPLGLRGLSFSVQGQPLAEAAAARASLLVTPTPPELDLLEPVVARTGTQITLRLRGRRFQNASALNIAPGDGLTVGPLIVNADGTQAQATLGIAASAAGGPRVVSLITPAGQTSTTAGASNTLTIGSVLQAYSGTVSALVGLQLGEAAVDPPPGPVSIDAWVTAPAVGLRIGDVVDYGPPTIAYARLVGVTLQADTPATSVPRLLPAASAGVAVGPVLLGLQPAGLVQGQAGEIVITGAGLAASSTLRFEPPGGIVPQGAPARSIDGTSLRQAVAVAADVAPQAYEAKVEDAAGNGVPAAGPQALRIDVVARLPEVVSIEPILARQGERFTLLVRGAGFNAATRLLVEPAAGLDLGSVFTVNAAGTEISVPASTRTNAALGARVIRVFNRAGGSAADAAPANTFTVYPQE